ncbi:hypothetical protein [Paracoccus contaminans]|uniref:hypothetical protein n=1 Tax=Paracoccus contaminans TaxID=1945662 RepID=UPI0012F51794|nr:hypothetical protein [Paracoccus contaminans]
MPTPSLRASVLSSATVPGSASLRRRSGLTARDSTMPPSPVPRARTVPNSPVSSVSPMVT